MIYIHYTFVYIYILYIYNIYVHMMVCDKFIARILKSQKGVCDHYYYVKGKPEREDFTVRTSANSEC